MIQILASKKKTRIFKRLRSIESEVLVKADVDL